MKGVHVCVCVCVCVCVSDRVGLESGKGGFVYAERCETLKRVLERKRRGGERRHWAIASER